MAWRRDLILLVRVMARYARIQIEGERIRVPKHAEFSVEHERGDSEEEIEFQFKWTLDPGDDAEASEDEPVV